MIVKDWQHPVIKTVRAGWPFRLHEFCSADVKTWIVAEQLANVYLQIGQALDDSFSMNDVH